MQSQEHSLTTVSVPPKQNKKKTDRDIAQKEHKMVLCPGTEFGIQPTNEEMAVATEAG